jgi:Lrp/AsnC family transcriptional regulator, leucine-responsive regulatory protein
VVDERVRRLDLIDKQILETLQRDGRMTTGDLGEKVSLSASPTWRRVQLLEEAGIIVGYHARLDRHRVGLGVHGFVYIRIQDHTPRTTEAFERQVIALPEVLSCHNLSGQHDYQLELVARDHEAFAALVRDRIRPLPGVRDIHTTFSLNEIKAYSPLPLPR